MQRIKIKCNSKDIPTKHLVITFSSIVLPETLETGFCKIKVGLYIPNPHQCFNCQRYGHGSLSCRGRQACAKCGDHDHPLDNCSSGSHPAYSRSCPTSKKEEISVNMKKNMSFQEARRRMSFLHTAGYADVARKGATLQQLPASARPTMKVVKPMSAPLATAAAAALPSLKENASTCNQKKRISLHTALIYLS